MGRTVTFLALALIGTVVALGLLKTKMNTGSFTRKTVRSGPVPFIPPSPTRTKLLQLQARRENYSRANPDWFADPG